jgi:hypothetical protein
MQLCLEFLIMQRLLILVVGLTGTARYPIGSVSSMGMVLG